MDMQWFFFGGVRYITIFTEHCRHINSNLSTIIAKAILRLPFIKLLNEPLLLSLLTTKSMIFIIGNEI